jgi:hypothetical protein
MAPGATGSACHAKLKTSIAHGAIKVAYELELDSVESLTAARFAQAIQLLDFGRSLIEGAEEARAIRQIEFGLDDGRPFGRCEIQLRLADRHDLTVPIEFEGGDTLAEAQRNLVSRIAALGEAIVEAVDDEARDGFDHFGQNRETLRLLSIGARWLHHAYNARSPW